MNASTVLQKLIGNLIVSLDELSDIQDCPSTQFSYGEKTAYVECLEWITEWKSAKNHGLDFEVEKRFPL